MVNLVFLQNHPQSYVKLDFLQPQVGSLGISQFEMMQTSTFKSHHLDHRDLPYSHLLVHILMRLFIYFLYLYPPILHPQGALRCTII